MTLTRRPYVTLATASAFALLLAIHPPEALAQGFNAANGSSVAPLLTLAPGHTIGGLDADSAGNLYYFDNSNSAAGSSVIRRGVDGALTTLLTLDSTQPGNFLRVFGNEIYGGAGLGSNIAIATGHLAGDGLSIIPGSLRTIATVNTAFDLEITANGTVYLSSATYFQTNNQIFRFNTGTGALASVIDATGDYSGPITTDTAGNLYYGASGYADQAAALYRFSASELAGGTSLTLDAAHRLASNTANASIAAGLSGKLFQSDGTTISLYDFGTNAAPLALGAATGFDYASYLTTSGSHLFFSVTDFGSSTSAIFMIPEPAVASFASLTGALWLGLVRRRRGSC